MKTLIFLLMTLCDMAAAESDSWFCTDQAGKRSGKTLYSCGIGESTDEGTARKYAANDALREFETICQASADCDKDAVTVDPQRTSCKPYNGHWKCYRLLVISDLK